MKEWLSVNVKKNSIFFRLLAGFLAIILLLISLAVVAFSVISKDVQGEMIANNEQSFDNLVERYENHIRIIRGSVTRLYFDNNVLMINEQGNAHQFEPVNQLILDIQNMLGNDLLYIDNIVLQFRSGSFVLDKRGPSSIEDYYSRSFVSEDYDASFWREQFGASDQAFLVLKQSRIKDSLGVSASTLFSLPIIFHNKTNPNLIISVYLNPNKLFESIQSHHGTILYMLDTMGQPLFQSSEQAALKELNMTHMEAKGYLQKSQYYFFKKKGEVSGLTYVNFVPYQSIADKMWRLKYFLLIMLLVTLLVSLVISLWLSQKFNNPIQSIIRAIKQNAEPSVISSKITEFNYIYDNIRHFNEDIREKSKQLQHQGYMHKLKNIYSHDKDAANLNKPYYLIVFHFTMMPQYYGLIETEQNRAAYYIKELINAYLSEMFENTETMQSENDQIISLIFTEASPATLVEALHKLKSVFDQDKLYCSLTIAAQPVLHQAAEFTKAYEDTVKWVNSRKLSEETQLILKEPIEPLYTGLSSSAEQDMITSLQTGSISGAELIIYGYLQQMKKKGAPASHYADFAREVVSKLIYRMLSDPHHDLSKDFDRKTPYEKLNSCVYWSDYKVFFEWLLSTVSQTITYHNERTDPFRSYLIDYIRLHYNQDISLSIIAEKMNVSQSYLSRYFKDKIGKNFIDYLSEYRIDKAKEFMSQADWKIHELATEVGYLNVNSFIRMFKKITGLSPGEYKRLNGLMKSDEDHNIRR